MDKQKVLDEAKRNYEEVIKKIETAQKICDKVDHLLPKGWESRFLYAEYLEFRNFSPLKIASIEFRVVCDFVEKATGTKLNRRASGSKKHQTLIASIYSDFGTGSWFTIWIEADPDDTCKFTFKRQWQTIPIADENCLGIRKEV